MKHKPTYFIVFVIGIIFLFMGCSTVRVLEGQSFQISSPYFKEAPPPKEDLRNSEKPEDYKIRKKAKQIPFYIISPVSVSEDSIQPDLRALLLQEIDLIVPKTVGKRTYISEPWTIENPPLTEFQKEDIDAIIIPNLTLSMDSNSFQVDFKIIDPINQKEFGNFQAIGKFILPKKPKTKGKLKRVELYRAGSNYKFLKEILSPQIEFSKKPDKSEIAEVLKKSISGNLSVSSTSGDTIITVDGKDLGKLPVTNFLISDGIHTLEFSKPGKTPIAKEVWLRAGETREIFQEWDDDYTLGALNVLSYPSGLKISWDDYLKGETPLFSNDMSPGNYKIEFSKQKQGEENTSYILDEEIVKVEAKKISTVAFPVKLLNGLDPANESIWVNAGEGGIYPQFGKELIFQKLSEPIPGWHGISTHPLISGSLDATITAYSQEEVGNGKMAITFFQNEKDNYTVELENSRISLYKFPSDGVSIANYEFKNNDPEKGRPVRFVTDKDKQQLKIYFGNKKVFETEESFHNLWRIALWIKSDSPPKSKTFRSFSITYPKIALPEK